MGNLFLISTPIGNLEDISIRAIKVIRNTKYLLCEDTRRTGQLLKKLDINTEHLFISYYDQTEFKKIPQVIKLLTQNNVVLISDAGTPLISDPGYKLVSECVRRKIKVISIPGASAVLTSLLTSGLPPNNFWFIGYMPDKEVAKEKLFAELLAKISNFKINSLIPTIIFFESPNRLINTLNLLRKVFGDINVSVCRELTKIHEELIAGPLSEITEKINDKNKLGEITVLFRL